MSDFCETKRHLQQIPGIYDERERPRWHRSDFARPARARRPERPHRKDCQRSNQNGRYAVKLDDVEKPILIKPANIAFIDRPRATRSHCKEAADAPIATLAELAIGSANYATVLNQLRQMADGTQPDDPAMVERCFRRLWDLMMPSAGAQAPKQLGATGEFAFEVIRATRTHVSAKVPGPEGQGGTLAYTGCLLLVNVLTAANAIFHFGSKAPGDLETKHAARVAVVDAGVLDLVTEVLKAHSNDRWTDVSVVEMAANLCKALVEEQDAFCAGIEPVKERAMAGVFEPLVAVLVRSKCDNHEPRFTGCLATILDYVDHTCRGPLKDAAVLARRAAVIAAVQPACIDVIKYHGKQAKVSGLGALYSMCPGPAGGEELPWEGYWNPGGFGEQHYGFTAHKALNTKVVHLEAGQGLACGPGYDIHPTIDGVIQ